MKLLGIISVGFDMTDQLLIRSFAFFRYFTPQKHNAIRLETTTKQGLLPLKRRCHRHEPADQVLTNIFNRLLDIL
jgi:hypothetical protein